MQPAELFAGSARLTSAILRQGAMAYGVDHVRYKHAEGPVLELDLAKPTHQQLVMQWLSTGKVAAVHLGPPCGTASRAREIVRSWWDPAPLRSDQGTRIVSNMADMPSLNRLCPGCQDHAPWGRNALIDDLKQSVVDLIFEVHNWRVYRSSFRLLQGDRHRPYDTEVGGQGSSFRFEWSQPGPR